MRAQVIAKPGGTICVLCMAQAHVRTAQLFTTLPCKSLEGRES